MPNDWRLTVGLGKDVQPLEAGLRERAPAGVYVECSGWTIRFEGNARTAVERAAGPEHAGRGRWRRWHTQRGWLDPAEWTEPHIWRVVATLADRDSAGRLEAELEDEGLRTEQDGSRLEIGGLTEPDARWLAERLHREHAVEAAVDRTRAELVPGTADPDDWRVEARLGDGDAARALRQGLKAEGLDPSRFGSQVDVRGLTEQDARSLAARILRDSPPGAGVGVEVVPPSPPPGTMDGDGSLIDLLVEALFRWGH